MLNIPRPEVLARDQSSARKRITLEAEDDNNTMGFAAARARAEALMEALPGSSFGKKTQARASLSRKDQENMIARSNRAFQTGIGPDPYPSPAPPRAAEGVSGWRS